MRTQRKQFAAVLLCALAISCASTGGKLVLVEDAVHDALAKVDDGVRGICTPEPELLKAPCASARSALLPALEAGAAFNRAVATQKVSSLADLISAIGKLVEAVKQLPKPELVIELGRAVSAASQEVQ